MSKYYRYINYYKIQLRPEQFARNKFNHNFQSTLNPFYPFFHCCMNAQSSTHYCRICSPYNSVRCTRLNNLKITDSAINKYNKSSFRGNPNLFGNPFLSSLGAHITMFPLTIFIPTLFTAFYLAPPTSDSQSTNLIQHTNLQYTITLKISISINQPQPSILS